MCGLFLVVTPENCSWGASKILRLDGANSRKPFRSIRRTRGVQ
jgi:hypothetical protein